MAFKKGETKKDKFSSVKKKQSKTLSKKKQKSLAKSAEVMIEKMNAHTTDDDIMNIMMSLETGTDTKATEEEIQQMEQIKSKNQGLESLKKDQLQKDIANDEATNAKREKTQNEITEQLKLIDSFTL